MIVVKISDELRNTWNEEGVNPVWKWCVDNFGPPEPQGHLWGWNTVRTFWFHQEDDAMWFKLKWA